MVFWSIKTTSGETMKLQRVIIIGAYGLALLSACSSDRGGQIASAVPFHRDILTHALTIDSHDLPDEYQFVNPTGLAVDAAGNVYVTDDSRVKVFDASGEPLTIIGGPGEGPGEFATARNPAIGPQGHLAVQGFWTSTVFDRDGALLKEVMYRAEPAFREYLRERGITFSTMYRVIPLSGEVLLVELKARNYLLESIYCGIEPLLLVLPDTLREIAYYQSRNHIRPRDGGEFSLDFQGELLWTITGRDEAVYIETGLDCDRNADPPDYTLRFIDLQTFERDSLAVPWEPVYIPEGARLMGYGEERFDEIRIRLSDDAREILRDTDYYPPLKQIFADGPLLYGLAYCASDTAAWLGALSQNGGPRRADIIDTAARRLLARAEFPFLPDELKHGRVYRIVAPSDDLARIEIYRLDDRLTGTGR